MVDTNSIPNEAGDELKALRDEFRRTRLAQRLTQAEVAAELHVTQAAVSAFELGHNKRMRPPTLAKLEELLRQWRTRENVIVLEGVAASGRGNKLRRPRMRQRRADDKETAGNAPLSEVQGKLTTFLGGDRMAEMLVADMSPEKLVRYFAIMEHIETQRSK